jgi:hypothetical protein
MKIAISISLAFFLVGIFTVSGYSAEMMILLPKSVERVHLGMSYAELKKEFPKSRDISGNAEDSILVGDFFHAEPMWDSIMYDFEKGKLASFSLLKGVVKAEGVKEVIPVVITRALREYGKDFGKKISFDPSKRMHPVFIWAKNEFKVYLSYSPTKLIDHGRQVSIRLTFATPDRKLTELFELPTQADMEEALFNILIGEEIGELIK